MMSRGLSPSGTAYDSTSRRRRQAVPRAGARGCRSRHRTALVIGAVAGATAVVINVAAQVPRIVDATGAAPSGVGAQPTITCPAGAIDIRPATSIQSVVNEYPGQTTFCLRAGVHQLTSSIRPKTGNTFVGEYGAVLDGSSWSTSDDTQAAFRAQNPRTFERGGQVFQKQNAYIFDFAPERTLTIFDAFANNLNANPSADQTVRQENIRTLLNFFPVLGLNFASFESSTRPRSGVERRSRTRTRCLRESTWCCCRPESSWFWRTTCACRAASRTC